MRFDEIIARAISFKPEQSIGPVAAGMYYDNHEVSAIMGPVGSAKTSTCLMKIFRHAILQRPNYKGIRYYKHVIIRDTYRELAATTIKSWNRWIPREIGEWKGGGSGEPASHHLRFKLDCDNTIVDLQVEFMAMGDNNAEDMLKGLETTSIYLNEADLLSPEVISFARGRIGRYPNSDEHGKASWYGIWADFNAPEEDNYCTDLFIFDKPEEFAFFEQPSGLSPDAENLKNLPEGYYQKQMIKQKKDHIRRMIENKIGFSRSGEPVYDNYNDLIHCSKNNLQPVPGLPLYLGMDAGLTPAGIIAQRMPDGQWLILREIVGSGIGVFKFADEVNRVLKDEFPGFKTADVTGDPAAKSKSSTDKDERSWLQLFNNETALKAKCAPTNNITPRIAAVDAVLTRMIDGKPGIVISPACKKLRRGFVSGYFMKDGEPDKGEFSHIHDALQYCLLGGGEYYELMRRNKENRAAASTVIAPSDFKVF